MFYTVHFRTTAEPKAVTRILKDLGWELQGVASDMEPDELGVTAESRPTIPDTGKSQSDASHNTEAKQELKDNFGARVPETGKAGLGDLDSSGMPWDERIHSSTSTKTKEGLWRKKKGVPADLVQKVEAERRVEGTVNGGAALATDEDVPDYDALGQQDSAAADFGINAGQRGASDFDNDVTKDQLRDKLKEVSKIKGLEACLSVLQQYDAQNVSGLNPADYGNVYQKLEEVGAQ